MKVRFVEPERIDPNRDRGIAVPYAPAKRYQAHWRWYLILLVVSSPLLYFAGKVAWSSVVIEAPAVISQEQITVRTSSQGYVDEVFVKPMTEVVSGTPLVRLRNPALSTRIGQLQAELRTLEGVKVADGANRTPTVNLEDQLQIANQLREQQRQRLDMVEQLYDQGAATDAERAAARSDLQQSNARIAQINQEMITLNKPPDGTAGQEVRARIASLRSEIAGLEKQNESLLVTAPSAGRVVDLVLVKGDQLAVGGKIAMIAPEGSDLHLDAYVPPKYSQYARDGLRATVVFPDGRQRLAQITDVPEITQEIPIAHPEIFGAREVGVLVRMKFLDDGTGQAALIDGLPVTVRFENRWNTRLRNDVLAALRSGWASLQSVLDYWRS
ncbi:MAG: HlyD family efflux transporter periplasmic adaptor subunit [Nevskiaceae bacterium]|nr:MAG: HlyD family efflux transporter periplasmic adaptor subunit [Nevskiaceae bacterium]